MAGDWIKMRPSLLTSPKVNGIARILEESREVGRSLSTGFSGPMREIVSRNVMRNVTVAGLLTVWGAANEHTVDGVFANADLSDIDDMVGIPGFGKAMAAVGWAVEDGDAGTVTLPNFSEYNTCGKDRAAEKNAERQRRFREKRKAEQAAKSNVMNDVTNNDREEKRREEKKTSSSSGKPDEPRGFEKFWSAYPRKVGKDDARRWWLKRKPDDDLLADMLAAIEDQRASPQWQRDGGQFIPHPATWLNQGRWQDEIGLAVVNGDKPWAGAI